MGLTGAAVGFNNALQRQLAERFAQKEYEDKLAQQALLNAQHDREMTFNEGLRSDNLAETKHQHDIAAQDREAGIAEKIANTVPAGTEMGATDPGVAMSRAAGYGGLYPDKGVTPEAPPSSIAAPDAPTGALPGTIANSPFPNGRIVTKRESAKQIDTRTDNERQAAQQQQTAKAEADRIARENANATETHRHNVAVENRPQSNATVTIQTVDDNGNPVTRVMSKTDALGKDFKKGPNAATGNRLDSAKAVTQTGEDIIRELSDPAFMATVGPLMGRASKLGDLVGNPPPEFAHLAGQIESYSIANMGVHGMRSAQGAAVISKLLDQRHTPESLIETIKGLNGFSQHFLENAGRGGPSGGGTVRMTAPDGRSLQVPADKVAELERAGAKRVP